MQSAVAAALTSQGVGGNNRKKDNFRVGAAIFKGPRLLMAACNKYKQSTKLLKYTPWPFIHAESAAILRLGFDECVGATLYVCRVLRDRSITIAKPCPVCKEIIKQSGLKECYYTNREGIIEQLEF